VVKVRRNGAAAGFSIRRFEDKFWWPHSSLAADSQALSILCDDDVYVAAPEPLFEVIADGNDEACIRVVPDIGNGHFLSVLEGLLFRIDRYKDAVSHLLELRPLAVPLKSLVTTFDPSLVKADPATTAHLRANAASVLSLLPPDNQTGPQRSLQYIVDNPTSSIQSICSALITLLDRIEDRTKRDKMLSSAVDGARAAMTRAYRDLDEGVVVHGGAPSESDVPPVEFDRDVMASRISSLVASHMKHGA
jgi:hypothetical protein